MVVVNRESCKGQHRRLTLDRRRTDRIRLGFGLLQDLSSAWEAAGQSRRYCVHGASRRSLYWQSRGRGGGPGLGCHPEGQKAQRGSVQEGGAELHVEDGDCCQGRRVGELKVPAVRT